MNPEAIDVPSGLTVQHFETITDRPGQGLTYRFRFVAPQIARASAEADLESLTTDMEYLCTEFALPRISPIGPQPGQIVISLADREVEFGQPSPEATQFFEAFSINSGTCQWEPF